MLFCLFSSSFTSSFQLISPLQVFSSRSSRSSRLYEGVADHWSVTQLYGLLADKHLGLLGDTNAMYTALFCMHTFQVTMSYVIEAE